MPRLRTTTLITGIAIVGGLTLIGGGAAVASGVLVAPDGTITACVSHSGAFRIVDHPKCNTNENLLTFNQRGPTGPAGAAGAAGAKGDTGPAGANGANGSGYAGSKGETGAAGANGAAGATGVAGKDGRPGADGASGGIGPQGPIGLPGNNGADGATILSGTCDPTPPVTAFVPVTLQATRVISSLRLIDSGCTPVAGKAGDYYLNTTSSTLFGPKTDTGWPATGLLLKGAKGAKGDTGDTGDTGVKGDMGAKGDAGINGTTPDVSAITTTANDALTAAQDAVTKANAATAANVAGKGCPTGQYLQGFTDASAPICVKLPAAPGLPKCYNAGPMGSLLWNGTTGATAAMYHSSDCSGPSSPAGVIDSGPGIDVFAACRAISPNWMAMPPFFLGPELIGRTVCSPNLF